MMERDYDNEEMWDWIDMRARETIRRHKYGVHGQVITRFDSADAHLIAAAIEWADNHPTQLNQPAAGMIEDEL